MPFLVEIVADTRATDWRLYRKRTAAENAYFRAFAIVVQEQPTPAADGKVLRLLYCNLYEVTTADLKLAKVMVHDNEARRLQSSSDPMCGVPIELDLFRVLH